MRTAVITLAIALLLGVCVWWTTKDSIRSKPDRDRVGREVPAVVAREHGSAVVITPSAPTTVPPDKPAAPTTVTPHKRAPPKYQPNPAVQEWLVGELEREGLSEPDSKRILQVTTDKLAKCYKHYGRFPKRPDLYICDSNAIQETGMSEAYRHLAAQVKAANAAYRPPPDQAPHPPDAGSHR